MIGHLPLRGYDRHGSGAWLAPRGSRTHNGIDYACYPGTLILAPVSGVVTKLGYPYSDDISFRYVQITSDDDCAHRIFYVLPSVDVGDLVSEDLTVIGEAQDLTERYPGITNHTHYEIKQGSEYLNPLSPR